MLKSVKLCGAFAALSACQAPSEEADALIKAIPEVREQKFANLSTDAQIAVFPELMRSIKPRPVALSLVIARGGRPSGLKVAAAIVSTQDARDKANLLQVLEDAQDMGGYNVCDDPSTLQTLLPEEAGKNNEAWQLQYSLELIDMCLRPTRSQGRDT